MKLSYVFLLLSLFLLTGCNAIACYTKEQLPEVKTYSIIEDIDSSEFVVILQNKVYPVDMTVKPGTTIVWKNADGVTHTLVADDGSFLSPSLEPGDVFSYTFDELGEYEYFSLEHKGLQGSIIVE